MDSDYLPSSDAENDSSSSYSKETNMLNNLSEDDISNITIDIYEQIESYIENKIILISSPNFYSNMVETISNIIIEEWNCFRFIHTDEEEEDVTTEITEFVEQILETYLQFSDVPRRERRYSVDLDCENDIPKLTRQIRFLQNIPQPTQKTKEWYEFRNGLISASNLWKVFGTESQRNSLIYEKCQPINKTVTNWVNTDSPMHWGNKYEPVTVLIYENMFGTQIGEFGCIQHPQYKFIGASPDGINIDPENSRYGRMLEIKNIVNREITGIPKEEYWIQTQIQMEVCDLDECDFMETRFLEYANSYDFYTDDKHEYKGVILHFIDRDMKTNSGPVYKYMPVDIPLDNDTIELWVSNMRNECKKDDLVLFTTIYWYLEEYSCILIQRNRSWFKAAVPKIEELWNIIEKERVDGYEHRANKKKISVSMNTDLSNSYFIKNMPLQNSICLVKLD